MVNQFSSQEEEEIGTLRSYLRNCGTNFDEGLLSNKKIEPADILYNGIEYQITHGDKSNTEDWKKTVARSRPYSVVRDVSDIVNLLLRQTLEQKLNSSDKDVILLIDVSSDGNRSEDELRQEVSSWVLHNKHLCGRWKKIYLVFSGRWNIEVKADIVSNLEI